MYSTLYSVSPECKDGRGGTMGHANIEGVIQYCGSGSMEINPELFLKLPSQ